MRVEPRSSARARSTLNWRAISPILSPDLLNLYSSLGALFAEPDAQRGWRLHNYHLLNFVKKYLTGFTASIKQFCQINLYLHANKGGEHLSGGMVRIWVKMDVYRDLYLYAHLFIFWEMIFYLSESVLEPCTWGKFSRFQAHNECSGECVGASPTCWHSTDTAPSTVFNTSAREEHVPGPSLRCNSVSPEFCTASKL